MYYVKTKNLNGLTYWQYENNNDTLSIFVDFLCDIKCDNVWLKKNIAKNNGNYQIGFNETWLSISDDTVFIKNTFSYDETNPSPIVKMPLDVFYKLIDEWAKLYHAQVNEITLIQDDNGQYRFEWE